MKKSRFTEPQILAILKQGESGVPVPDLCREHGMITPALRRFWLMVLSIRMTYRTLIPNSICAPVLPALMIVGRWKSGAIT